MSSWYASIPSPGPEWQQIPIDTSVCTRDPDVRALHPDRHRRRDDLDLAPSHEARAPSRASCSTSSSGRSRSASSARGSTTCSRTRRTTSTRAPTSGTCSSPKRLHLGGRERHLRRPDRWRHRCVHRLPLDGHPVLVVRRRPGPRTAARPGARPPRQLLQPGALRPADEPAVGPRRSTPATRRSPSACPTARSSSRCSSTRSSGTSSASSSSSSSSAGSACAGARCSPSYLIWYGVGRSYLESIRIDPSEFCFLGIPSNVWAAFAAVVLGIMLFIVQTRRHPGLEPSVYRPGREWVRPDAEVDSDDTDSDDEVHGEVADGSDRAGRSQGHKLTRLVITSRGNPESTL